jgi:hypothetical protein
VGEFQQGLAEALSPYVRALAWWHAIPQPPPSNLKDPPKRLSARVSRWQMRVDAGEEPDLPDIDPESHFLIEYLLDAGPVSGGSNGAAALSWGELQAWQAGSGVSLPPWQLRLLRRLSGEYLSESFRAEAHDAPPPWEREADRARIAKHIRKILRG